MLDKLKVIGLLLLLGFSTPLIASQDFYHLNLAVPSQDINLPDYITKGMKALLTKLTTTVNFQNNPVIEKALLTPQRYLKRYRFTRQNDQDLLAMVFDPSEIDKLLQQAELSKWADSPSNILTWVSMTKTNRFDNSEIIQNDPLLAKTAEQLGINTISPTMDLSEITQITPAVMSDTNKIKQLSARYNNDLIVTIQIVQTEDNSEPIWQSNWQLINNDSIDNWSLKSESLLTLYTLGFEQVKQKLVHSDKPGSMQISIDNINSSGNYQQVLNQLQQIKGINQVELDSVTADAVLVTLDISLTPARIKHKLDKIHSLSFDSMAQGTYFYHYQHEAKTST